MQLHVDTDAAYLVLPKACSWAAGFFYLTNKPTTKPHPTINEAVLIECTFLCHVVSSAAEAECGALFHNARQALPIRNLLIDIGHPQPPTTIITDNSTAQSFIYDNIHQKGSKSWDMRYYWLRDRKTQQQFHIHNQAKFYPGPRSFCTNRPGPFLIAIGRECTYVKYIVLFIKKIPFTYPHPFLACSVQMDI